MTEAVNANRVVVLPGDGIGPEIIGEAVKVLQETIRIFGLKIELQEKVAGGAALDSTGEPLPADTLQACRSARAVLHGTFGGPQWEDYPLNKKPLSALLTLRKELDVYANLRRARPFPAMLEKAPLKKELLEGVDLMLIREVTSGIYFGPKESGAFGRGIKASDTMLYSDFEIERVARQAFAISRSRRGKVTCVDKANVLECSRLWRKVMRDVHRDFPEMELNFMYVDDCALQLVLNPRQFDVIIASNIFGDILSNVVSGALVGSVGVLPSATLGEGSRTSLFGPIHGPVNEIAGQNLANPLGAILSTALMLEFAFGEGKPATVIENAVEMVLEDGYRSAELMVPGARQVGTSEMGDLVVEKIRAMTAAK